jgi:hypothetical protein
VNRFGDIGKFAMEKMHHDHTSGFDPNRTAPLTTPTSAFGPGADG